MILLHDLLGLLGSGLIVLAFAMLQMRKITADTVAYPLLNLIGASLVLVSLVARFNLAAFILEIFWIAISIFGLIRNLKQRHKHPV